MKSCQVNYSVRYAQSAQKEVAGKLYHRYQVFSAVTASEAMRKAMEFKRSLDNAVRCEDDLGAWMPEDVLGPIAVKRHGDRELVNE